MTDPGYPAPTPPGLVRIGVSVAVPEPWAGQLRAVRKRSGDSGWDQIKPHITLLMPTAVAEDRVQAVHEHVAAVAAGHPPFEVHLHGTGTFRPISPVVFVRVVEGTELCEELEGAVRSGMLAQNLRFPYHPHVTIAHEVPDDALDQALAEMADFDARFVVAAIEVFEHGDDGNWRLLDTHPLVGS